MRRAPECMLQAFSTRLQAAVGSLAVPPDSAEVVEALKLIRDLPLDGAVVTGDVAFTYRKIVEAILDRGGHYFLFVKTNQPELQAELAHAFGGDSPSRLASRPGQGTERIDPKDMRRAETVEKAHGRVETRRIAVRPIPARLDRDWPGARQIVRIERLRELKDRCSRQVVYAITSIAP